jgi:pseudouridine synthase
MKERVQKLMAQANIGSRRASEEIIRQGRVTVNGKVISLGAKADPATDKIVVDGEGLRFNTEERSYYVLSKPAHVLSSPSVSKEDTRQVARDLVEVDGHLFAIGRLDAESEGLMIFTNDGDMTNKLTHPRYEHTKTYKVWVQGDISDATLEEWQNGVYLEDGKTSACFVKVIEKSRQSTTLRVVMIEGKKRQIRRVANKLGHPVKKLMRTHIGQLGLGTLRYGEWYRLGEEELAALQTPSWELEQIRKRRRALRAKKSRRTYRPPSTFDDKDSLSKRRSDKPRRRGKS